MATTDTTAALKGRLQAILAGRYTIDRELGHGGMATVFLAQDVRHGRAVAIKLLDPALTSTIGVERFLREIAITARLHHPHILTLIESGQEGGLVYYVMPHIEGESLRDRFAREPPLTVAGAVWIAREVADGLAHAHDSGVIHRDIKPENILVAGGHAWVADFGIARALETCAGSSGKALTMTGLPIGTPAYMSPEQVEGRPDVDGRSDIYSLGCVLFEMLVGRPPFLARSARAVMNHHVTTPPPSLAELRPALPPALTALVERAIGKRPEDRFPDAHALGEELQLVAATAVTRRSTPPDTPAGPPAEPTPGSRSSVFLFAAAAVAAVALAVSTLFPWGGVRSPGPSARPPVAEPAADSPAPAGPGYTASIAVMPLATYSGDEQSAFLSEGITEEIIAQLARIPGLKVISRTSVLSLASKRLTVPQIAETLGVRHVLEGSVQGASDRVRVTFQLIDARSDAHVWVESYDRSLRDLIGLRRDIAGKVAGALAMTVPGIDLPAHPAIESSPGYEPYLKGSYWLDRTSPDGLERAIGGFEEAIRLDSTYAPAYAGLSSALRQWVTLGYRGGREPYATFARASAMADRALALDSTLALAYIARALVRINAWAPDAPIRADLERALALMPNSGQAHMAYSLGLAREGRYAEALAHGETAVQLDPLSAAMHASLALSALGAGRNDVAIRESRRTLSLEPGFAGGYTIEALALLGQGRPDSCLGLDFRGFPEVRALCLAAAGHGAEASRLVDSAGAVYRAGAYEKVFQVGLIAAYHALRGDRARAVEWLDRAYAVAPTGLEFRVLDSDVFARMRGDPEYRAELAALHRRVYQRVFR